jgi:dipeptidyl aminopeptidase/acylaminoacyl peptidase
MSSQLPGTLITMPKDTVPQPKKSRPLGSWPSAVTPQWLTAAALRLSAVQVGLAGMFWVEGRPSEGGRMVVVKREADGCRDWVPPPFSARTRVHEYGGGAYCVSGNNMWFVDFSTQQLLETQGNGHCRVVAPTSQWRLADLVHDVQRHRLIAVGERHSPDAHEADNAIVAVDLQTGDITPLVTGRNFYATPRLDPSGKHLAFIAWDHPYMPWDAAELWVCALDQKGVLSQSVHVAGDNTASVFGATWSPEGKLAFSWEKSGYWDLYTFEPTEAAPKTLLATKEEFALPLWQLGMSTFGWLDATTLVAAGTANGLWKVYSIDTETHQVKTLVEDLPALSHLFALEGAIAAIAASPMLPTSVVQISPQGGWTLVKASLQLEASMIKEISAPHSFDFPTKDGDESHAFFYPPHNTKHSSKAHELPPLILIAHSGPTAQTNPAFSATIQFWTTRGFAVIDVNYRGSTGYGRAFREKLQGQWGVADVEDCVAAARFAANQGWVDPKKMAIRGSSAGGFTVLAALAFHKVFAAGASLYGVADLAALAHDTHKFESHYLNGLIGPYPAAAELYRSRSPQFAAANITAPVIFFQGKEDKVVPPSQAEAMFKALKANGIGTEYICFDGEQHGFRRAETITRVFTDELAFYRRVMNLEGDE